MNTYEALDKKFNQLNKDYLKLDNSVTKDSTEDYCIMISLKLEKIQKQMSDISIKLENF